MNTEAATTSKMAQAFHQNRLRKAVKRLVIELGYLEYCLEKGLTDAKIRTAAGSLDTAIDCLSEHISD